MEHECKRCGKCCMKVGTTFWVHGNLKDDGKPFGDHILLNKLARGREAKDDGLPCEMFNMIGDDMRCHCQIERYAGRRYKPIVCREFPEEDGQCLLAKKEEIISLTPQAGRVDF